MPVEGDRRSEILKVCKGSLCPEQQVQKLTRGGEIRAFLCRARRPPDVEYNRVAAGNYPRLEQAWKLTRMIDMQVGQKNDVGV